LLGSGKSGDPSSLGLAASFGPRHLDQASRPKLMSVCNAKSKSVGSGCNSMPINLWSDYNDKPQALGSAFVDRYNTLEF